MHIFFQNNQYLGSYYFTRSADDPVQHYNIHKLILADLHKSAKSLCPSSRGDPEDSETPPKINFLMSIGQENGKKQSGTKTAFLNSIRPQF